MNSQTVTTSITCLTALEHAVRERPLCEWDSLLKSDPVASFYQGPGWTLPWYRAYAGSFAPLVLVLHSDDRLVGVVPLAVEQASGRLVFAGDGMADYRDVVALPEYREETVRALLRLCRERGERAFRIGPTSPASNTCETVIRICRSEGIRTIRRKHFGWRWDLDAAKERPDPLRRKAVRYALNHLRRRGGVAAEVVRSRDAWDRLRNTFFEQHSLRQLYGNRPVSFDDPQKQQFFRDMFDAPFSHVTVLTVGDRPIAGHFGYRWKDSLYWAAPWFDFREQQSSPGLLLVLLTMQRAEEWGFSSFDLTEGDGYLKERFSTTSVPLSIVELYARPMHYVLRRAVDHAVTGTRSVLRLLGHESIWRSWSAGISEAYRFARIAVRVSPRRTIGYVDATLRASLPTRLVAVRAPDAALQAQSLDLPGYEIHTNQIADLLKGGRDPYVLRQLSRTARRLSKARGSDFHTILRDGKLVAWGCSRVIQGAAEALGGANIPSGAAVLHDFEAVPGEHAALATLLAQVVTERRKGGSPQVWLVTTSLDRAARRAFDRATRRTPQHTVSGAAAKRPVILASRSSWTMFSDDPAAAPPGHTSDGE